MWAVLPLKDFVSAKQRLSGVLSAVERRRLFHAMVEDVLNTLTSAPSIEGVVIVSDDPTASLMAEHYDICLLDEPDPVADLSPLNTAINAGCEKVLALAGDVDICILHADLPEININELERLASQRKAHSEIDDAETGVMLVSDRHGTGTNVIVLNSKLVENNKKSDNAKSLFYFGRDSFQKHQKSFTELALNVEVFKSAALSADIDTPSDLMAFLLGVNNVDVNHCQNKLTSQSIRYCRESTIGQRLQMMWMLEVEEVEAEALVESGQGELNHLLTSAANTDAGEEKHKTAANYLSHSQALTLASNDDLPELMRVAAALRDAAHGSLISYSKKVFIPLTKLCRDVCHYCTFATTPKKVDAPYLSVEEVLSLAKAAEKQGCKEALFTLGEKPELRYRAAREALAEMGFASTLDYVAHVAGRVAEETNLLPHINAGCMDADEIKRLRTVSASMGIMLETSSERLSEKGMPHYGSPDKHPAVRLETIRLAGELKVPFTSGILIGIGETRLERVESMLALRDLHEQYGHLQEVIIQNFRAKPNTKMAQAPDPSLEELLWTIAVARIIFGGQMHIQAPPNLSPGELEKIIQAGIDDWGGVSPLTPDHVNPEAPWPHLDQLAAQTRVAGKFLHERLTIYPSYAVNHDKWVDDGMRAAVLALMDSEGWPRTDSWVAGITTDAPAWWLEQRNDQARPSASSAIAAITQKAMRGEALQEDDIVALFSARNDNFWHVCNAADTLRQSSNGNSVRYVVNRNINYTNICYFKCQFCAFSKGKLSENLRGRPYDLSDDEIQRRTIEAWQRGATEVCMQGGIHPGYTGQTYIDICHSIKSVAPEMHIHAFSPLEIWQGAKTLGLDIKTYLQQLVDAGLSTLPGTAAEILDDEVRATLCPEKIRTEQWLHVMEAAHSLGMNTTATIMYGHIETPRHWAKHLLKVRGLQERTGGFTELVPLPFVPEEAPLYLKGKARKGPTFREAVLMHAVARLALHGQINNIQTSWVKMGEQGVAACLNAGANDLGGTLMNETITRSAGAQHGQEMPPAHMDAMITRLGRLPSQRSTCYGEANPDQVAASYRAEELLETINNPPQKIVAAGALNRPGLDDADILLSVK